MNSSEYRGCILEGVAGGPLPVAGVALPNGPAASDNERS